MWRVHKKRLFFNVFRLRESKPESASFSGLALNSVVRAVLLKHLGSYRKAQSCALGAPLPLLAGLLVAVPYLFQIFFRDMEKRAEALQALPEEFPDLVVTTSIVNNIEINSRDATKGVALQKLAAYLSIPIAQTMAFGDDRNDITMLEEAGIGVAMGNAGEEVKRAADYVTDDCNNSGVAHAMQHFLWENEP